jgi:hypothetical protein
LIPVRPVEAFDVVVLVRFSRLNALDHHAGRFSSGDELIAQELRAVIEPQNIGQAPLQA